MLSFSAWHITETSGELLTMAITNDRICCHNQSRLNLKTRLFTADNMPEMSDDRKADFFYTWNHEITNLSITMTKQPSFKVLPEHIVGDDSVKGTLTTITIILVLSLAAWSAFYILSDPLTPEETTIVVGFIAIVVLLGQGLWKKLAKQRPQG